MTFRGKRHFGEFHILKSDLLMWLFLVALTLPHTNPPYLNRFSVCEMFLNIWRLASFLVTAVWAFLIRKKISLIAVLICIWEAFLLITTIIHQGDVYKAAAEAFSVLSIVLLYDVAHNKGTAFLSSQLFCFEMIIYVNLITEMLFPDGLYTERIYFITHYKNWFLGYYNTHTKYFIPAIMFALLYAKKRNSYFRSIPLIFAIFLSSLFNWSGGVILSLFIMFIVYVFFKNNTRLFNYFTYWLTHILFFFTVYILQLQNMFRWLIDNILGKWRSLESRITYWERTVKLISKSPVLGHGVQSQLVRITEIHLNHGVHSHNMLLEILYQGGMIGLGLWIAIVITAGIGLYRYRNSENSKIIATAFLGWCVATLVEPFTTCFLMGMFVIAYYGNCDPRLTRKKVLKR